MHYRSKGIFRAALALLCAPLTKLLKTETDKYTKVIKAAGIKLQ